ncbi:hypothetical protein [Helicobacter canadensis]|nr:hypothetical protein [Helicobacter canadensis]EFR48961.1 hypothetical protein HCMG_01134 [Helicobacter canadensis MIT 98-5491]STP00012.1 Uncharacterised protein [Helicobacter canadensis]
MFFQKTIESCHTMQVNLTNEMLKILQTSGIAANLADLTLDKNGIYFSLPNQTTTKVMLYQAKIQESLFRTQGEPLVHLSACDESLKNYDNADFLAIIRTDMQFFLSIYSHKIQTKIFNQKPLNLCPHCHNLLHHSYQDNLQLFFEK